MASKSFINGPRVIAVSLDTGHNFTKTPVDSIMLLQNRGVKDDRPCSLGDSPEHLRQVSLISFELLQKLNQEIPGFSLIASGQLGESITTQGIELEKLEKVSKLHFLSLGDGMKDALDKYGQHPVLRVTSLRPPGPKMDKNIGKGLMQRCKDEGKAGNFAVVEKGGEIKKNNMIFHENC